MRSRLVHDEQGVALVMALLTMIVLSILTTGIIIMVTANQRESLTGMNAHRAFGIAETCLAYAEGDIYGADAAHDSSEVVPGQQNSCNTDSGTGLYWSNVAGDGKTWTMYGQGTFNGVTREVSAQANVPGPVTKQDTGVWNYLYSNQSSGTGSTNCDTSIGGSTTVSVPMYVNGNLCLSSAFTGSQLGVGGNLVLSGGKGAVGASGSKIQLLGVGGKCDGVTTGTGVCNGSTSPIYATSLSSNIGINPGLPALNLTSTYNSANPGPASGQGCPVGSGQPSNFFDNDTSVNLSDGSINLFPATDYDCVNGSNEIKWCATVNATYHCTAANTMTVNGTFYFDGNLSMQGNSHVVYSGLGSIYVTGTITTSGNFSLCGIASCTSSWDTASNALILVAACWANSTGSTLVTSKCVNYGGTNTMQVGTYCATDYYISGNSTNWGPVLANTLELNGNLSELIPLKVMPPGTPTNTATSYLPASAPTYWSG